MSDDELLDLLHRERPQDLGAVIVDGVVRRSASWHFGEARSGRARSRPS